MVMVTSYPPLDWPAIMGNALRVSVIGLAITGVILATLAFHRWREKRRDVR